MASTDTVRGWYRETVRNHSQRGTNGYEPDCRWGIAIFVGFPNQSGSYYSEPVHPATVEAWKVYVRLMGHHGVEMSPNGGVNQCRNIATTDWPSLHAYLVACDLPPNEYKPQAFIDDVLRVRTNSGAQVFLNGAVFADRMHDQINCSQSDLATGIDPDTLPFGDDMAFSKGLSAAQWRNLYQLGIAKGSSENAVVDYWTDARRTDEQHEKASAEMFETLAEKHSSDGGGLSRAEAVALIESANLRVPG